MNIHTGAPAAKRQRGRPRTGSDPATILRRNGITDDYSAKKLKEFIDSGEVKALQIATDHLWGKPMQRVEADVTNHFPTKILVDILPTKKAV